jgi:cystathionine beta-lyase/cystathionine gamma-synthase
MYRFYSSIFIFGVVANGFTFFWQIVQVYYPGLESHPEHHIAKRQMTGFGGVVSFEVIL